MIKKSFVLTVMVSLLTLLFGCDFSGGNTFTFIIDPSYDTYITMGTSADYAPYEWLINDGSNQQTVVGIDIEIAKVIAHKAGKNLRVINKGFDFLLEDLKNEKVDFVISAMTPTDERSQIVDFSDIYYMATQVMLIQEKNIDNFTSIEVMDKNHLRIGAQLGSIQQTYANDLFTAAQKQFLQSVPELVIGLTGNQLAGIIMEKPVAEGYLNNLSGLAIAQFELGNPEDGSAVAVKKGDVALLDLINEVIFELITSGQMDQIVYDHILLNS